MAAAGLSRPVSIPAPRRTWSDNEWDRLRRGASGGGWAASVLGDRLSIADTTVGNPIYSARLRRELSGWKIVSAEVESDPLTYRPGNAEQESARLQGVIEHLLG